MAGTALAVLVAACTGDDTPQVVTERVRPGEVTETVTAPARVDAAARQDVAATVSGTIVALLHGDGDEVAAGATVVRLDSSQVALAQQQAAAAQAAAADLGGIAVQGNGAATIARVNEAVASLDDAVGPKIIEARANAEALAEPEQRAAALAAVEAVEAAYRTNRAGLLAAGEAIAGSQDAAAASLSDALDQAVRQATAAQRVQAQAAAAAASAQADELVVVAPLGGTLQLGEAAASDGGALPAGVPADVAGFAGRLGGLSSSGGGTLRVGAPVVAGQTLFTVFDLSRRYVVADVDEIDAPAVRAGQRARVLVDALPDTELDGVVESIRVEASTTEAGGVGYPVRVRLLAPTGRQAERFAGLRVGMTASAEIVTGTVTSDLVVPSRALLRRDGGTILWTVEDGRARSVPVAVDALGEDLAAVRAERGALEAGDRVVVSGYEELSDGVAVRVQRPAPSR